MIKSSQKKARSWKQADQQTGFQPWCMIGKSELMVSLVKPDSHKTLICPQEIQLLPLSATVHPSE